MSQPYKLADKTFKQHYGTLNVTLEDLDPDSTNRDNQYKVHITKIANTDGYPGQFREIIIHMDTQEFMDFANIMAREFVSIYRKVYSKKMELELNEDDA